MAIFGALYAVLVWILPFISFAIWQVRIADALLPQALIFGLPAAIGVAIGCSIGNFVGGLGPIDYIGGAIANFLAGYIGYLIEKRNQSKGLKRVIRTQLAIAVQTIINVFIVGTYLAVLFEMPFVIGWLGILIGSLIAMHIVGFLIYEALKQTNLFEIEDQTTSFKKIVDFVTRKTRSV